jgi:hypothetical protein
MDNCLWSGLLRTGIELSRGTSSERVLTDYNMDINPEREGRICLQIVPES